jgi:hypothetical protein
VRPEIVDQLRGGDRRSIGQSAKVARTIETHPAMFRAVFEAMRGPDPVVRMRAADAIEKATLAAPALLQPHTRELLGAVAAIDQKEVRWHVAQMLPRLHLTPRQRQRAVTILLGYLDDSSSIVKTFAMQALADLARRDDGLRVRVVPLLESLTTTGTPAMRSRGRKLLRMLRSRA